MKSPESDEGIQENPRKSKPRIQGNPRKSKPRIQGNPRKSKAESKGIQAKTKHYKFVFRSCWRLIARGSDEAIRHSPAIRPHRAVTVFPRKSCLAWGKMIKSQKQRSSKLIIFFKLISAMLSAIRLLPHAGILLLSSERELTWSDLDTYGQFYGRGEPRTLLGRIILFIELMTFIFEYRNVFYFRHKTLSPLLGVLCPPLASLRIDAQVCGPGLFIHHGFGTLISAEEIGAHCSIYQMVTVGYVNNASGRPKVGDNVTIAAGARVLGPVTIGDNAFISANSLVISDVPRGATVMGVPAKIVAVKACGQGKNFAPATPSLSG